MIKNVLTETVVVSEQSEKTPKPLEKENKFEKFLFNRTLWRTWFMVNAVTFFIGLVLAVVAII